MKKSSITKIVISAIFFVAFLTASLTLIIIAPKEEVKLSYEVIDEYRADEYNYYATYKITNNSYTTVEIDSIDFECTNHMSIGDYSITSRSSPHQDVIIPSGESFVYYERFHSAYELSDFIAKFEDAHFKNIDPTLFIGIALLLPMIISGYFFIVFMVKGIKEKNN